MIPGYEILPDDSAIVANLKREALARLQNLPDDPIDRQRVLGTKADYFASASLRIRPKETEGGLAPFAFNPIQLDHLAGLRRKFRAQAGSDFFAGIRDCILKPRQLGFTTYIAALFFFDGLFRPGRNCLVLTHLDKVSQQVLQIYRAFYDSLPVEIKNTVRLRRASALHLELEFLDENGLPDPVRLPPSSFIVHTAAGFDLRGITVHNLHCSEAAFYDNWLELVRGVFQAVPASGNIILESTANGFNHFKDIVDTALEGKGSYRLVFYPWFAHPEYVLPLDRAGTEALEASLDKEERALQLEHNVSLPALAWRRKKLDDMVGSVDSFRQEYPSNILDAFLSSGRPVFDQRVVASNFALAKRAEFVDRDDEVRIFAPPVPGVHYVLSADPAEGIDKGEVSSAGAEIGGTDYSSASVRDARTLRTMARIHGRIEPVEFARKVAALGEEYNEALVVVERNNHGHLVLYVLEESGYPNLYRHLEYDAAGQSFLKLGFPMNLTTRPLVVDTLREVIRRDAYPCSDAGFWSEALVFVYGRDGKASAMPSRHDDRVMDHAIGAYVCTLGANAWGGAGILQSADGAGLPIGKATVVRTEAPSPLAQVRDASEAHPPLGSSLAMSFPAPFAGTAKAAEPVQPEPEPVPAAPAPHAALAAVSEARAALQSDGVIRCGVCLHRRDMNGIMVCGLHGWKVGASDPDCGMGELPAEDYNDQTVQRVSIGGVE